MSTVLGLTCHVDVSLYHQTYFITEDIGIAKHDKNALHNAIVVLPQGRHLQSVERIVPAGIWICVVGGTGRNESAPWLVVDVPGDRTHRGCSLALELDA